MYRHCFYREIKVKFPFDAVLNWGPETMQYTGGLGKNESFCGKAHCLGWMYRAFVEVCRSYV